MDSMTQSAEIGDLVAAIAAVTGAVGTVRKTGQNTHHRYSYASDEDLAAAVGPLLAEHGLAMTPAAVEYERNEDRMTARVTWQIAHSSGQWMRLDTIGEGCDRQDKAGYKCLTGARKYALRLVFCIATGDDAERHTPAPRRTAPAPQTAPAGPAPRARLIDAAKAAAETPQTFTRWVAAINRVPDRLLSVMAARLESKPADQHADALDALAASYPEGEA